MPAINKQEFLEKFQNMFEDTDVSTISTGTAFRDIEEWDSMMALTLIAMADDEYDVKLTGDDIRSSATVEDLFDKISAK